MRRIDLNLLYVLRELLREPNTTKVGEKLGLTQSAVSASLGRLRWAFQDDLFVRSGRAMAPTRRAETLLEPVEDVIRRIEALVEEVRFEPDKLKRTFHLSTAEWLLELLGADILAQMHPQAPQTRLVCSNFMPDTRDRLRSGHLDLIIAPVAVMAGRQDAENISVEPIYEDHLVAVVASDSERYGEELTEEEFLSAHHIVFHTGISGTWTSSTDRFLSTLDVKLSVVGEFSSHRSMVRALRGGDLLAVVPKKLLDALPDDGSLRHLELPFEFPTFEVGLGWSNTFDTDPEHQWFRQIVSRAAESI